MRHLHNSYVIASLVLIAGVAIAPEAGSVERQHRVSLSTPTTGYWQTQTTGIAGSALYTLSTVDENVCWLAGASGTIIRTLDAGNTWSLIGPGIIGTQNINVIEGISDGIAFAATTPTDTTIIYRTNDGGSTWNRVFTQHLGHIDEIRMLNSSVGFALGEPIGGTWTILKTTNGGKAWDMIPTSPPQIGGGAGGRSFASFGTQSLSFFDNMDRNYTSGDGGATWLDIHFALDAGPWYTQVNANHSWLAAGSASAWCWCSYSGWTYSGPVPRTGMAPIALSGAMGTREFWLLQDALYYTSDAGVTWTSNAPNGLDKPVTSIDIVTLGSEVSAWAVGISDTVYHYHGTLTGIDEHPQPIPREFSLGQNYPNPFNPSTNIRFEVPVSGLVSINVYNMLGQEVATLVNEEIKPGSHDVTWEAIGLPSGVYFYQLHAGSFVETKKLVLLR